MNLPPCSSPRNALTRNFHFNGQNRFLQCTVKVGGVFCVAAIATALGRANNPSGHTLDVFFQPPAVEDAQARQTVVRSLRATGARGFMGRLGRVQP
jgi:hypothetical protein